MRFIDYPVLIVVWTQAGCEACEEFAPAWRAVASRWASCVPSVAVDCARYKTAADLYRVQETPTTMILRYGRASWRRLRGAVTQQEIEQFYQAASVGLDCQL